MRLAGPLHDALAAARLRAALELRDRVAGEDGAERAERIWSSPGERWYSKDEPVWRVHDNPTMYVGGIRALLLQSLHPLAMAGVAGHSGYKSDPWGRLARTSNYIATSTFGTIDDATELIEQIKAIHLRVRGKAHDGRPYRASDPHLLRWVHIAEIDSFLAAYQAFATPPLTPTEADDYVARAGIPAEMLGVLDAPRSVDELRSALASYASELEATDAAIEAARFLLLTPPIDGVSRVGYSMLAAGAVALLPPWARRMLRVPVPDAVVTGLGRPAGRVGVSGIRWIMGAFNEDHQIEAERRDL